MDFFFFIVFTSLTFVSVHEKGVNDLGHLDRASLVSNEFIAILKDHAYELQIKVATLPLTFNQTHGFSFLRICCCISCQELFCHGRGQNIQQN